MYLITKRGNIAEVEVVEDLGYGYYTVKDVRNEYITENVYKNNLEDTYQKAKLVSKEISIKNNFKNKKRINDVHTCEWCSKKDNSLTVDHIQPLSYFGGIKTIRNDYSLWKKAWSESNLQILCEECNRRKGSNTHERLNTLDFYARKKQYSKVKGKRRKQKSRNKTGYGISTTNPEMALKIAKSDSNVIRLDVIFNKRGNRVETLLETI